MRKTVLISLCVAAAIVLVSCEKMGSENPVTINLDGSTKMRIAMQVNPDLGVASGEVTISKGDVIHTQAFEFDDGYASVLFIDLQPGIWLIEVALYDENGYMLYEGSGEAGVVGGQTTTAQIVVEELSGDLEVIIELPPSGAVGLIAYYPFSGNAEDQSGNGYHCEVFGATPTDDRFGNPNSAYQFDGIDDYLESIDIEPFMLTSWTIVAWFKATSDDMDQTIVGKPEDPETDHCNFHTHVGTWDELYNVVRAGYETCGDDHNWVLFSDTVLPGEWHFMAYTRDHSTGETNLYIDALGVVDSETWLNTACANYMPVWIGAYSASPQGPCNWFDGVIDDVRIYDRALSAMEIGELYSESPQGCIPPPAGLIGWWPGDGDVADIAGGNHGTILGGMDFDDGIVQEAFRLDDVDDGVEIPNTEGVYDLVEEWTVMAWVFPFAPGWDQRNDPIVWKTNLGTEDTFSLGWGTSEPLDDRNRFVTGLERASDGMDFGVISEPHLPNSWYHVTGVYDGADVVIYVNGIEEGRNSIGSVIAYVNPDPLRIGNILHSNHGNAGVFDGLIDEVAVFDRALLPDEIAAIHLAGSAGMCKP